MVLLSPDDIYRINISITLLLPAKSIVLIGTKLISDKATIQYCWGIVSKGSDSHTQVQHAYVHMSRVSCKQYLIPILKCKYAPKFL